MIKKKLTLIIVSLAFQLKKHLLKARKKKKADKESSQSGN
jgi:hypothetical protein